MLSKNQSGDRILANRLNADLRNAQLELLSAQCATDRLRHQFSIEDIAKHGHATLLRRAVNAVATLHDYYFAIEQKRSVKGASPASEALWNSEELMQELATRLSLYAREQRARYWPQGQPITEQQNAIMERFFSSDLLAAVRIVELAGQRLPNPPFYEEAKSIGFSNLPEITHMASTTFVDVIVFNERATERSLFHGLVHAVQFKLLGTDKYCETFIRALRKRNSYFNVPFETHAMSLEARFAGGHAGFSVEKDVSEWINSGRYVG